MSYGDFKDLSRGTASDKVLRGKAFNIAKSPKYEGYQRGLASMVYKFFDMNSLGSGTKSIPNQPLADEFYKPIIKKFKRTKVYSSFKNNICISKNTKWFRNSTK